MVDEIGIPWDSPEEPPKMVNPILGQLHNPISAKPTSLLSLLETVQSLQTVDTGAQIFCHNASNGSSRNLSPLPVSSDLTHSRENSVSMVLATSIPGHSAVIPQDAPISHRATHAAAPATPTDTTAIASPVHDSGRSATSLLLSNAVPKHSVRTLLRAGAAHASKSPQPEVGPPVPM